MTAGAPSVLVSSTFYDLRQIRADLAQFISDDLGYLPLLSELDSFPIDPNTDTIENCRRRVQQNADLLILVIGGRYGYVDAKSARSVTNIEYLAARNKGIPIYAFVESRVLTLLPVWESNPNGDFSAQVDNVRVFDFIREIRTKHSVWMREFQTAQDIVSALRNQFAYLTKEGIRWSMRLNTSPDTDLLATLQGRALRLALERPSLWEFDLLSARLKTELEALQNLKREYDLELALGVGEGVPLELVATWGLTRLNELRNLTSGLSALINKATPDALGAPGESGDPRKIIFVAQKLGEVYRQTLEWASRVRRASVDDRLCKARDEMAKMGGDLINKIEFFGPHLQEQIDSIRDAIHAGEDRHLSISLDLELANHEAYDAAWQQAMAEILG